MQWRYSCTHSKPRQWMENSDQFHAPTALLPVPIGWGGLGGLQRRSGRGGGDRKSHRCPCRELKTGGPAPSLISIFTEQFRMV
jgi:hypothetical protein